jgi:hypothetical protein
MSNTSSEWRSPQLVRDLKPERPGYPERVTAVDYDTALALLFYKLHNELYEVETDPNSAEEVADFLTAIGSLRDAVEWAWNDAGRELDAPLEAFTQALLPIEHQVTETSSTPFTRIHRMIEHWARNMLHVPTYSAIIVELARASAQNGITASDVSQHFERKLIRYGAFNGHLLWQSTEFQRPA